MACKEGQFDVVRYFRVIWLHYIQLHRSMHLCIIQQMQFSFSAGKPSAVKKPVCFDVFTSKVIFHIRKRLTMLFSNLHSAAQPLLFSKVQKALRNDSSAQQQSSERNYPRACIGKAFYLHKKALDQLTLKERPTTHDAQQKAYNFRMWLLASSSID